MQFHDKVGTRKHLFVVPDNLERVHVYHQPERQILYRPSQQSVSLHFIFRQTKLSLCFEGILIISKVSLKWRLFDI